MDTTVRLCATAKSNYNSYGRYFYPSDCIVVSRQRYKETLKTINATKKIKNMVEDYFDNSPNSETVVLSIFEKKWV